MVDFSKFRQKERQKKKALKQIEKESRARQELENRKLAKASKEETKRIKMELKQFKQQEKAERKQRRKERIEKFKARFSRKKNKPIIDESGVA